MAALVGDGYINSDTVVACFDIFADMDSDKKRVVIMDNASIHTGDIFLDCIEDWERAFYKIFTNLLS